MSPEIQKRRRNPWSQKGSCFYQKRQDKSKVINSPKAKCWVSLWPDVNLICNKRIKICSGAQFETQRHTFEICNIFYFIFFFKVFGGHMSFFWGHWYPCFGFLVMSPLGFKARVGSALFTIFAEANVMYIPQDSPLVLHLPTSWWPARSQSLPHMHVQRCNRTNRRRTRYHCASDPAWDLQH